MHGYLSADVNISVPSFEEQIMSLNVTRPSLHIIDRHQISLIITIHLTSVFVINFDLLSLDNIYRHNISFMATRYHFMSLDIISLPSFTLTHNCHRYASFAVIRCHLPSLRIDYQSSTSFTVVNRIWKMVSFKLGKKKKERFFCEAAR